MGTPRDLYYEDEFGYYILWDREEPIDQQLYYINDEGLYIALETDHEPIAEKVGETQSNQPSDKPTQEQIGTIEPRISNAMLSTFSTKMPEQVAEFSQINEN